MSVDERLSLLEDRVRLLENNKSATEECYHWFVEENGHSHNVRCKLCGYQTDRNYARSMRKSHYQTYMYDQLKESKNMPIEDDTSFNFNLRSSLSKDEAIALANGIFKKYYGDNFKLLINCVDAKKIDDLFEQV